MSSKRILIIEDEPLIAMMLEDFIETLGYEICETVDSVDDALAAVAKNNCDIAIVDVNLRHGEASWPVADALDEAGIPFLLASGGQLEEPPERHSGRIYLSKPYTLDAVEIAIGAALA